MKKRKKKRKGEKNRIGKNKKDKERKVSGEKKKGKGEKSAGEARRNGTRAALRTLWRKADSVVFIIGGRKEVWGEARARAVNPYNTRRRAVQRPQLRYCA